MRRPDQQATFDSGVVSSVGEPIPDLSIERNFYAPVTARSVIE